MTDYQHRYNIGDLLHIDEYGEESLLLVEGVVPCSLHEGQKLYQLRNLTRDFTVTEYADFIDVLTVVRKAG